jgi:hypothetical protein
MTRWGPKESCPGREGKGNTIQAERARRVCLGSCAGPVAFLGWSARKERPSIAGAWQASTVSGPMRWPNVDEGVASCPIF